MPFYKEYPPLPELAGLVRSFQVYHVKWDEEENFAPPFITCLANTEQNLYFLPNDPMHIVLAAHVEIKVPPVIITGPKDKPVGLLFGKDHLMIKALFHPTGTYRLCGMNMMDTVNKGLDATHIWGDDVAHVLHQLQQTTSYDRMVDIIAAFLSGKCNSACRPKEPIDDVAIQMLDPMNHYSLKEWASQACLSPRQFERNFIMRVGIPPKLFRRIVRFEYAMHIKNATGDNWSAVAVHCQYADSSHLLKEFKEFAEFPPSQFYQHPTSGHSALATG